MPKNYAGIHLAKQLLRSGTSVSLNYGEAKQETNELVTIFVKSIETAQKNIK